MNRLLSVIVPLVVVSSVCFANPPSPDKGQRWAAYNDCYKRETDPMNTLGIKFIVDAVSQNYPKAVGDWAQMMLSKTPDLGCYAYLTPEEAAAQKTEQMRIRQNQINEQHLAR